MGLTKEQADKIVINPQTVVGYAVNTASGAQPVVEAEELVKWAYRRLETWPDLLTACESLLKVYRLSRPQIFGTDPVEEEARAAISAAKGD